MVGLHFLITIHLHLASFYATKYFWKKLATIRGLPTEQIFELRGPGPLAVYVRYFYNWLFSWQNNNLQQKFSSGLLFTAKILQETKYFTSPYMDQIKKFNPKMKDFKRGFGLKLQAKEGLNN